MTKASVIIPAWNEEHSIGRVLQDIPRDLVREVIVVDNGSTDSTTTIAEQHGARVVREPRRGYGSACLRGIEALRDPEIVVFLDADYSDYPEEMERLLKPIQAGEADFVVGSRILGTREKKALPSHARFGNWLAVHLIYLLFGFPYTDLGPFRAIRYEALRRLNMKDTTFGWTIEMQIKAIRQGLRIVEVPVSYRRRIGKSKISGTISGSIRAGTRILWTIFKYAFGRFSVQ